MKSTYLFPAVCKKMGWCLLVPFGLLSLYAWWQFFSWGILNDVFYDEVGMVGLTVALLLVGFSKEKEEDECVADLRARALVWATFVGYALLLVCTLLLFETAFLMFVFADLYLILVLFVLKYHIDLYKFRRNEHD